MLQLCRIASFLIAFGAAGAALAAPTYIARGRLSQFDAFTEDTSPTYASVSLNGGLDGDVTATATGTSMDTDANAASGGAQNRTADAEAQDIGIEFSSNINALAVGGLITVLIPYELTYNIDVTEPPAGFNQGSAALDIFFNARLQPADNLIVQESGLLTLLNSVGGHGFINQTGPFMLETAQEDTLVTINGTFSVDLPEDPGNPIEINLDTLLSSDAGGTVGPTGFAEALASFDWDLSPDAITDGGGTPLSNSGVTYSVDVPAVPSLGAMSIVMLLGAMALLGSAALQRAGVSQARTARC
jgi:hypothetical protein